MSRRWDLRLGEGMAAGAAFRSATNDKTTALI
jgi:hypothetical protein